jgi:ABC-type glycerol-3-phosphate transport system substrate-binding protein
VFLFAQGNAAMIATGTWDAGSLWQQVEGDFPILIFDFPVPAPGEKYSRLIKYRVTEAAVLTAGLFGLSKFSRNPETAIDFMHFLTSLHINEELNRRFRWFPAIRGARTDKILEPFAPKTEGIYNVFYIGRYLGPDTELRYLQQYADFISTVPKEGVPYQAFLDAHYKRFITRCSQDYLTYAADDFVTWWRNSYSAGVQSEMALAQARARAMREGLTPEVQRNLAAVTLGQARRLIGRAVDLDLVEQAKAALKQREARQGDAG